MKRFSMVMLTAASALSIGARAQEITTTTLENGLTVILNEDHRQPKVFGLVLTKAGAKDDPHDATGMAHYMEHVLFKGTTQLGTSDWEREKPHIDRIFELYDSLAATNDEARRAEIQRMINDESVAAGQYTILNELSALVNRMGGTGMNAFTSPDVTAFFNTFPPNQMEQWLDLYAHRFGEPVFRGFQAELEVVYEEKNMYEDQFMTKLLETFNKNMFKKHPYGQRTTIGTTQDLKNPSLTKMREFYRRWYVANNMALVLTGDFDTDSVMPVIAKKFGALRSGDVPEHIKYDEPPFQGRELVTAKLTPIRMCMMGYRTPAEGHPDKLVMDVVGKLLNNGTQTGLLDRLSTEGKVLGAMALQMPYHDYGSTIVVCIPKLVGQKFEEAEQLIRDEMAKIARGEISDQTLESIKNEFYRDEQVKLESLQEKALGLAFAFAQGLDLESVFTQAQRIQAITKDDVARVARQYLADDYLVLQSGMGRAPVDKIDKPGFKPLVTQSDAVSAYKRHYDSIPSAKLPRIAKDYTKDLEEKQLSDNLTLYRNANPVNDIYTLTVRFGAGDRAVKNLEHAVGYMNLTGVEGMTHNQLREAFALQGAEYSLECDNDYTTLIVSGIEEKLAATLPLVNKLLNEAAPEPSAMHVIYQGEQANRKMEAELPENVAQALYEYAAYGDNSRFLARPTLKQVKAMTADDMISTFREATGYAVEVFYVGKKSLADIESLIKSNLRFRENLKESQSPTLRPAKEYDGNMVFFTNKKKAAQTNMIMMARADIAPEERALMEAFNVYIGGGFSGLLLQEVREYRSMAYSVSGIFHAPRRAGHPATFFGQLGTQADKTLEAMAIVDSVLRQMPQKPERLQMIREYLTNRALTLQPDFRAIGTDVVALRHRGYTEDPTQALIDKYATMTWEELYGFYVKMLKDNKMIIALAGDKKRIDMNGLKQYGQVVEISESKLFSK